LQELLNVISFGHKNLWILHGNEDGKENNFMKRPRGKKSLWHEKAACSCCYPGCRVVNVTSTPWSKLG